MYSIWIPRQEFQISVTTHNYELREHYKRPRVVTVQYLDPRQELQISLSVTTQNFLRLAGGSTSAMLLPLDRDWDGGRAGKLDTWLGRICAGAARPA